MRVRGSVRSACNFAKDEGEAVGDTGRVLERDGAGELYESNVDTPGEASVDWTLDPSSEGFTVSDGDGCDAVRSSSTGVQTSTDADAKACAAVVGRVMNVETGACATVCKGERGDERDSDVPESWGVAVGVTEGAEANGVDMVVDAKEEERASAGTEVDAGAVSAGDGAGDGAGVGGEVVATAAVGSGAMTIISATEVAWLEER